MVLDIFGSIWIQSRSSRAFLLELEPSSPKRIEVQMICAQSGQTDLGDLDYEEVCRISGACQCLLVGCPCTCLEIDEIRQVRADI